MRMLWVPSIKIVVQGIDGKGGRRLAAGITMVAGTETCVGSLLAMFTVIGCDVSRTVRLTVPVYWNLLKWRLAKA